MSKPSFETPREQISSPAFDMTNLLMGAVVRALELGAEKEKQAQKAKQDLEHMEKVAMLDHLTGLRNRRALARSYVGLQSGGRRQPTMYQVPSLHSLLVLDVDKFKTINDTSGHDKGDEILKRVAGIMNSRSRENDIAARLGGDEFAILFPYTSPDEAFRAGEDIGALVEASGKNRQHKVTVSVGVAPIDLAATLEDNLHLADLALYQAKAMGRNLVALYDPSMTQEA
ncbi:MAG TPA: GGDEF domain-containing protein [Candidatus Dormibacteraeota bacterium]|nr:GGDEF domain-containing protein [Candidatus Dormibacteraeota bacterium]